MDDERIRQKMGAVIRQLRKDKGLSQPALSKSGEEDQICDVGTLKRIEAGKHLPRPHTLYRIISMLDVSHEEFHNMVYGTDMRTFNNDFSII